MTKRKLIFLFVLSVLLVPCRSWSDGAGGTTPGLTLLRSGGARSSALGEAFTSVPNDITAMEFNPASLATLESGQTALQYERGIFDDAFSKAMLGFRTPSSGVFGLSLGYYNSGKTDLFDGNNTQQSVIAEQDRLANLGYGFQRGSYQFGASVQYLSSNLAQSNSASATSLNVGLQHPLSSHLRIGVSGPLVQSKLQYADTGEKLPRLYRAGVGWLANVPLATGNLPLQFLTDVPYDANAHVTSLALGVETHISVMALRLGFNTQSDVQQFSVGTGFQFGRMDLDYSFGMVGNSNVNAQHKITFSYRFDDARTHSLSSAPVLSSNNSDSTEKNVWALKPGQPLDSTSYRVYELKEGETLESVARSRYGSSSYWQDIYSVNSHMYASPDQIKAGSTILLPVKKGS